VPARDLAYWDEGSNKFVVEPGTYQVKVGPSSASLPVSVAFDVTL
jgi:hypothetical protein